MVDATRLADCAGRPSAAARATPKALAPAISAARRGGKWSEREDLPLEPSRRSREGDTPEALAPAISAAGRGGKWSNGRDTG